MAYKTAIVQELSENINKLEDFRRRDKSFEEHLFKTCFSETISQPSEIDVTAKDQQADLSLSTPSFCWSVGSLKISKAEVQNGGKHYQWANKVKFTRK